MTQLKAEADRNLSMAKLLPENGFADGAVAPLQEAVHGTTQFLLFERGQPEQQPTAELISLEWNGSPVAPFIETPSPERAAQAAKALEEKLNSQHNP